MSWIPFRKQQKKPHSDLVADNEFDSDVENSTVLKSTLGKCIKIPKNT